MAIFKFVFKSTCEYALPIFANIPFHRFLLEEAIQSTVRIVPLQGRTVILGACCNVLSLEKGDGKMLHEEWMKKRCRQQTSIYGLFKDPGLYKGSKKRYQ